MFDLDTTEETNAVVAMTRSLGLDVLYPAARAGERAAAVPEDVRRALFDTGLTAPVDAAFGGGGRPTCATHVAAVESLAYGDPGLTVAAAWSGAAATVVGAIGTDAQRAYLLPRFATDPHAHGAVALYEGHGRAPSESVTAITRSAVGWTVRGTKLAVAGAGTADPLLVVGTDPSDHRVRVAVLTPGHPAVLIADPTRHIALDAAQLGTVSFDCVVGEDAILGGVDADPGAAQLAIAQVRLIVAAALLGTAQRATDYASNYANERIAFGKPIAAFQGVSFMLADSAIRIAAARLEMLDIALRIDAGVSGSVSEGDSESRTTSAVNYAGVVATQATRDAIQVLGGHGFITDHPVELWYRSAAALAALDFDPLCSAFEPAL